jgi:hypothetical protein
MATNISEGVGNLCDKYKYDRSWTTHMPLVMHLINTRLGAVDEDKPRKVLKEYAIGHQQHALAALTHMRSFGRTLSYRMQFLQSL